MRDKGVFFMGECQVDWSCGFASALSSRLHMLSRVLSGATVADLCLVTGSMDAREAYQTRYVVGNKIIPLTEYNMTYVSTTSKKEWGAYGNDCDVPVCMDAPRCASLPCICL